MLLKRDCGAVGHHGHEKSAEQKDLEDEERWRVAASGSAQTLASDDSKEKNIGGDDTEKIEILIFVSESGIINPRKWPPIRKFLV